MSTFAQRSFAGGELSPSLHSRVDVIKYATGLKTCRNMIVQKASGAATRFGTEFICEVKDSTKTIRLIPFIFNNDQTYMLEFGDQYIRFIRNGVQLTVSGVAAWLIGTTYALGDLVVDGGINYYSIQSGNLGNTPSSSPLFWYPLTGDIYEIPTPYVEADLASLNYVQSGDIITLTHQNYAVRDLSRTGHTSWTLVEKVFAPTISAPTGVAVSGASGVEDRWVVTAIEDETFQESLPSAVVGSSTKATGSSPRTISWTAVVGAREYNVYKNINDVYGFVGVAGSTTFLDEGIEADSTDTPPINRTPFDSADNYPATAVYYQQRLGFANTRNLPEKCWFTKSGNFNNLTTSAPLQDDDAIIFNVPGRRVNAIQQMIDLGSLVCLTTGAEVLIQGDVSGILRPGEINPKSQSYNGSGILRPLLLNDNALFVQERGTIVRDLFSTIDAVGNLGYKGTDLTVFADHLFRNNSLVDWDYVQVPNSLVFAVRNDGQLLGLTYLKEHQIWAWHHHDTDGLYENVCSIPEGREDVPYFGINRTINGTTKRYIERAATRKIVDIVDFIGADSVLSFDGRNTGATTMILTGGVTWVYTETLTLTSSVAFFTAGDVGNQIRLRDADGDLIRFTITGFTSSTVVTGKPHKTVPVTLRAVAVTDWDRAVDQLSGLSHLEGKAVSILADGFVVSSPNNPQYATITVTAGAITLDKPYAVIRVGLPFTCDLETLNIDSAQSESLIDKKKYISMVSAIVEESRGIWAGNSPPADDGVSGLEEYKARETEDYDDPIALKTGVIDIQIRPEWNSNGRVFVRQVDPLPLTILGIMPAGLFPFRSGGA